jgi:hypothetical protein
MCYQPPGTGICVTFSHLWWGDASHAHTIYVANILWGAWAILGCLVGYYYRARIIPYLSDISLTPYPNPHLQTIRFILSTSAWISKTLLHICIIRIWIGSNAEIIHITFIPYHMKFLLQQFFRPWNYFHILCVPSYHSSKICVLVLSMAYLCGFLLPVRPCLKNFYFIYFL